MGQIESMPKLLTFSSLFSGCGGLDLGFQEAGFHGLFACDKDLAAVEVHNQNLLTTSLQIDLSSHPLPSFKSLRPDVVLAGPPCQGFSTLGKRDANDPRNSLLVDAARHAVSMKPKFIILENVVGAISGELAVYWDAASAIMRRAGFNTETYPIASSDFGVPQIRRRVIMFGWLGREKPKFSPEKTTKGLREALAQIEGTNNHEPIRLNSKSDDYCIAKCIKQHQKLSNVRGGERAVPTWDIPEVFGKTNRKEKEVLIAIQKLRRQNRQRSNGDADPILVSAISLHVGFDARPVVARLIDSGYVRKINRRVDLVHTFNGKYRRLSWEHPAPTVDTRFGEPRYFLHPDEHRGLSVREAARIQGFPDSFRFLGSRESQYRMVGNAVPPPLAKELALMVRGFLT